MSIKGFSVGGNVERYDYNSLDNLPSKITIDTALSGSSTNPVQNKVVTDAINTITDSVAALPGEVSDLERALDSYFTPPENYDRLTDKTAISNKAFDQTGNIIDGGSLLFPMYIPVEPNTTYVGSGFNYYGSVRAYDSNKAFVSGGSTTDGKKSSRVKIRTLFGSVSITMQRHHL